MPIISFTAGDALQTKVIEAAKYRAEIIEIGAPKASSSQKSVTFYSTFRITEGAYVGKELEVAYNTATSSTSLLGDRQFSPHAEFLKIEAAILNKPVVVEDRPSFDTDTLLNKPLIIEVQVQPKEDNTGLANLIVGYLPVSAGTGNSQPF